MADYHNWLEKAGVRLIGSGRSKRGTLDTAVAGYKKSDAFTKGLAEASQNMRRPILDRLCNMRGPSGQRSGDKNFAAMQRRHCPHDSRGDDIRREKEPA